MHTMHLLPGVAIHTNLELETRPKQLLGYLLLVIALPEWSYFVASPKVAKARKMYVAVADVFAKKTVVNVHEPKTFCSDVPFKISFLMSSIDLD